MEEARRGLPGEPRAAGGFERRRDGIVRGGGREGNMGVVTGVEWEDKKGIWKRTVGEKK